MQGLISALTGDTFQFNGRHVRALLSESGEPLFVGKDVCEALEIEKYRDALQNIPDWCRGASMPVDTPGGRQVMATLTRDGCFYLGFRSRKPEAEAFQKWICTEVLPALMRDGIYMMAGTPAQLPVAKLRLRLEAAELKARAKALEVRADRLSLPPPPEDYLTIGQYLAGQGIEPGHPDYFSQCSYLGNALRGQPHAWTRGRDRKPRRAYSPAVFESLGTLTAEV